ncbi:hypothetical protein HMPREF1556_00431 [Porphyromonas sp. oral taxon 278 str. W7784]|nr:hypothetical protein HMPREF1556_00431 [Porphyromonas sp. oral taxon 278 str. W7784]
MDLPFPSLIYYCIGYAPWEGEKGIHGRSSMCRSSMRPTVGRSRVFRRSYGRSFFWCAEGVGFFG